MGKLYTIKHNQNYTKTSDTYKSNLCIVNKDTLLYIAGMYGLKVPKSHTKDKMAEAISTFVLSNPHKCLEKLSVKELEVLKDFVKVGKDTHVVRPNRKFYKTMRCLLLVSVCHNKKERKLYFLLPDELRELFTPLLDKAIKEGKKREKAQAKVKPLSSKSPKDDVEEPEYLDDDDFLFYIDDDADEDDGPLDIPDVDYFMGSVSHNFFDSVLAVQDFHQHANEIGRNGAVLTLYASVVYNDLMSGEILYRSENPVEVRIDTEDFNNITISGLPSSCANTFSTKLDEMEYRYGVLYIKGSDAKTPYVVALM